MKKTLILLLAWMLTLPAFSQSSFPNDELIVILEPGAAVADIQSLMTELDMSIVDGPTANLGAILLKYNTAPTIPPGGNPLGPITGGKKKANSNNAVGGAGFNFGLTTLGSTSINTISAQENNCYDILDPVTQPNGGNGIITGIFDTGISASLPPNNGYFDPSDLGHNMLNLALGPKDDQGHGSHISSIIMNNLENANAAVQLRSYKTHDDSGNGKLFDVIKALDFAISDGVDIVNMSFGYYVESYHSTETKIPLVVAMERALGMAGTLFIASAGNDNNDNDFTGQLNGMAEYPAGFNLPNVIAVASADCSLQKSSFSNYGEISVDVFAPGEDIWGYNEHWNLTTMSGTSQAAAFVTKLATFLGTHQSTFNWYDTKCAILNGIQSFPQSGWVLTDGYIDSDLALSHLINVGGCTDYPAYKTEKPNRIATTEAIKYLGGDGNQVYIEITANSSSNAEIWITNISGNVLYLQPLEILQGQNQYTLDYNISNEFGIYFLSIKDEMGMKTLKFIR